jgi:hypothetical protein
VFYQSTIRKIIAIVGLFLFAFSITPQKNIHDLVAKHVDPTICKVHLDIPIDQVEKSSIHCSFDLLVVTSAFLHYNFELVIQKPATSIEHHSSVLTFIASCNIASFDSRGPPIV